MCDFQLLSCYWDDELPNADKARLSDHLAGCPTCQSWLRAVAALSRTIALFPHAPVPTGFAEGVAAAIEAEAPASLGEALRQLPGYTPKPDFLSRLMAKLPVCPPFEDLSAWVDGELDGEASRSLAAHLPDCGACRRQIEQLQLLSGAVRTLPRPERTPSPVGLVLELGLCPSFADLSAWVDGEGAAHGSLADHLDDCGDCRRLVTSMRSLSQGVRRLPVPVAGADLVRLQAQAPACPDRESLHAYHDGELDPMARASIRSHVETCDPCQSNLNGFRRLALAMAALPTRQAPTGFAFGVAARTPKARPAAPRRPRRWPAAMAAGMLVGGLLVFQQQVTTGIGQLAAMTRGETVTLAQVKFRSEDILLGEPVMVTPTMGGLLDEWTQ